MNKIRFKYMVPPYAGEIKVPMPLAPVIFGLSNKQRRLLVSTRIPVTCVPENWMKFADADIRKIRKQCVDLIENIHAGHIAKVRLKFIDDFTDKSWISPEINIYFSKDLNKSDCGILGANDINKLFAKAKFTPTLVELTLPS